MSIVWVKGIVAASVWTVGVASVLALWRSVDSVVLALVLLLTGVVASLLVRFLSWRATMLGAATAPGTLLPARAADAMDDLDDVLMQSFPASDPPSSTSGIACVQPAFTR